MLLQMLLGTDGERRKKKKKKKTGQGEGGVRKHHGLAIADRIFALPCLTGRGCRAGGS